MAKEIQHPGLLIKRDYLDPRGIGSNKFSRMIKLSKGQISLFLNGKASLSPKMAIRLSLVLGETEIYWLGLQNEYDLMLANQEINKKELNLEKLVA